MSDPRIIVALDYANAAAAQACADRLEPSLCRVKIGKELFTRAGPAIVTWMGERGFDVFLDLKFHDIPNTVAGACAAAADLGCWLVNVHASGGRAMLSAARDAVSKSNPDTLLVAVTILTSLDAAQLAEVGFADAPAVLVRRLATLSQDCGLDGVVCSAQEAGDLRTSCGEDFRLVTPGIRPAGAQAADQKRTATPAAAIAAGASYLVIGRPVTQSPDPVAALQAIAAEVDAAS